MDFLDNEGGRAVFKTEPGNPLFERANYLMSRKFPEEKTDREQDLYMHTISRAMDSIDSIEMLDYMIANAKTNFYVANEALGRRRQIKKE